MNENGSETITHAGSLNHVGISGGKDSTALLLWAVHESGYDPASLRVSFCDTGNEADETYEYVQLLSDTVHPIHILKPPMDFYELAIAKGRFPSPKARFCTQELKMKPTKLYLDTLGEGGRVVLNHSGVRAGESPDRALLDEREPAWLSYFGCESYRPLLRWSLADVWAIHARYGVPPNPLYAKGCTRVGCLPCVMSRKAELAVLGRTFPDRVARIRECETVGLSNARGGTTFFPPKMIPVRFRTGRVYENEKGKRVKLTMIDDVIRWATEGSAHVTGNLDFDDLAEAPTCDSRSGLCE